MHCVSGDLGAGGAVELLVLGLDDQAAAVVLTAYRHVGRVVAARVEAHAEHPAAARAAHASAPALRWVDVDEQGLRRGVVQHLRLKTAAASTRLLDTHARPAFHRPLRLKHLGWATKWATDS